MNMLRYYISILLLFSGLHIYAQDSIPKITKYPQRYGIRIGTDVFKASRNIWDKNYTGFEVNADYRLKENLYGVAEIGMEKKFKEEDQLSFTTKGNYIKIGVDYNLHKNWLDMENIIFVGGRYGLSLHSQQLHSYKIYTQNPYFGESEVYPELLSKGLSAHFVELVGGIKVEVLNNLFLSFSVRLNYLITQKQPEGFENLYLPGFGRKYSGNIGANFNYGISYFIPLYKKQPVKKELQ